MVLKRAVDINHGRGLSGTPFSGHRLSAAVKASCIASSARSKSPSKRISVARMRPESTRYRESSNSRIATVERSDTDDDVSKPAAPNQFGTRRIDARCVTLKRGRQSAIRFRPRGFQEFKRWVRTKADSNAPV